MSHMPAVENQMFAAGLRSRFIVAAFLFFFAMTGSVSASDPRLCFGYIRVRMEYDQETGGYPIRVYSQFKDAIASFVNAAVPGLLVDLRGNYGGFIAITLAKTGEDPVVEELSILPQKPRYGGDVVVLVNLSTTSSGEGVAMGLSRLPGVRVAGFNGTNGSFGMVQLDSKNGIGGVQPNLRVPLNLEKAIACAAGIDVELNCAVEFLKGRRERIAGPGRAGQE